MLKNIKAYGKNVPIETVKINPWDGKGKVTSSLHCNVWTIEVNGEEFNWDYFLNCTIGKVADAEDLFPEERLGYVKFENSWWLIAHNKDNGLIRQKIEMDKLLNKNFARLISNEIDRMQVFIYTDFDF